MITHEKLRLVQIDLPGDYEPYGEQERQGSDCSCGCKYFAPLEGEVKYDWGVCTNQASHRVGLLTFEHQGCLEFEPENT